MTTTEAKPTKTQQVERLEKTLSHVTGLLADSQRQIATLADKVEKLSTEKGDPPQLQRSITPEQRIQLLKSLKKDGQMGTRQKNIDLRHPMAHLMGLQAGDVVTLKEDSDIAKRMKAKLSEGEPLPLGVVETFLFVTKDGKKKYKVAFPGIGGRQGFGRDGCLETDLVKVES